MRYKILLTIQVTPCIGKLNTYVPTVQKRFLLFAFPGPICEECDFLEGNETRILPWAYILFGLCKVRYLGFVSWVP